MTLTPVVVEAVMAVVLRRRRLPPVPMAAAVMAALHSHRCRDLLHYLLTWKGVHLPLPLTVTHAGTVMVLQLQYAQGRH